MGMYIAKYQHFSFPVLEAETCNRIANRDLDQITASEQSDIGRHYLPFFYVAFPWVETSTGPGGFMICVFII